MSRTNIDYLFQVTTTSLERSLTHGTREEKQPPFGDLFNRASTLPSPNTPPRTEDRNNSPASSTQGASATTADESSIAVTKDLERDDDTPSESSTAPIDSTHDKSDPIASGEPKDEQPTDELTEEAAAAEVALEAVATTANRSVPNTNSAEVISKPDNRETSTPENNRTLTDGDGTVTQVPPTTEDIPRQADHQTGTGIAQSNVEESENAAVAPLVQTPEPEQLEVSARPAKTQSTKSSVAELSEIEETNGAKEAQVEAERGTEGANIEPAVDAKKSATESAEVVVAPLTNQSGNQSKSKPNDRERPVFAATAAENNIDANSPIVETTPTSDKSSQPITVNAPAALTPTVTTSVESSEGTAPVGKTVAKAEPTISLSNRLHLGKATAKPAGESSDTAETPRVDPARFVSRVTKAFQTAQERGGALQIRLSPPELGAMRMELSLKDGVMTASLETENSAARQVLLDNLPALRERLAEQNIRIDRFDVEVRREPTGGQPDGRTLQDHQQSQQGHGGRRPTMTRTTETAVSSPVLPTVPTPVTSSGINLVA